VAQDIYKNLAEDARNNYNKKHWLEVDALLVRKKNPEHVYISTLYRKIIIQLNHNLACASHFGIDKTSNLVLRIIYSPKIRKDISGYVKIHQKFY
jgi:hypothetical protein